jgi:hypothetical protein
MGFFIDIRSGRTAVRVYNQMRLSFLIIGIAFIVGGVAGLFGYGTTLSNGRVVQGLRGLLQTHCLQ